MERFDYFTKLRKGVNLVPLKKLKQDILDCDYLATRGDGRSGRVGQIFEWWVKSLGGKSRTISTFGKSSFPDQDTIAGLKDSKKKMVDLTISGSGTSSSVVEAVEEMMKLKKGLGEYLKVVAVTSYPKRSLAKLADYSIIIPGRTKDVAEKNWVARQVHPEKPTMGDDFEEKSLLWLYATMKSAQTSRKIGDIIEQKIGELKTDLGNEIENGNYQKVKEYLKRSHDLGVFCYGWNQSGYVGKMVANRMSHYNIKTYVIRETNTPGMGYGRLGFLFSASGKNEQVLKIVDDMREVGATVVGIVGNKDSPLEKKILENGSGAVLHVGTEEIEGSVIPKKGKISSFYFKAPVVTNYLLRDLGMEMGITERFARNAHE